MLSEQEFETVVAQTLDNLPTRFARRIVNLAVVIEEYPDAHTLNAMNLDNPLGLLGFYHGIPLTNRTHDYGMVLPDKISIYRQPILASCTDDQATRACIRHTVLHELAHYFGIDDDRLDELGVY